VCVHRTRAAGRILDGPKTNSSHPRRRQSNLRGAEWRLQATGGGHRPLVAAAAAAAATPSVGRPVRIHPLTANNILASTLNYRCTGMNAAL